MYHDAARLYERIQQQDAHRTLRFGATLTIGEYVLPNPLLRLLQQDPEIRLQMRTANTQELLRMLDQGALDFAIVEGYFDKQVYDSLVYCTQRYIPVCAPNYSFAHSVHKLEDLLGEPLLVRELGSGTRNVLERALEERSLSVASFRRHTELGSLNLIKKLVCAGAGISFFYQPVVQAELDAGQLREVLLSDCVLSHEFTFLWRRGSVFSAEYQAIFRLLRSAEASADRRLTESEKNAIIQSASTLHRKKDLL